MELDGDCAAAPRASSEKAAQAVTETTPPHTTNRSAKKDEKGPCIEFQRGLLQSHSEGVQGQRTQIKAVSRVQVWGQRQWSEGTGELQGQGKGQ